MAKTLIAVFPDDNHAHIFEKFTKQFKKLKGKFDLIFVVSKKNYKYIILLERTKFEILKNKDDFEDEIEQAVGNRNILRDYALKNKYEDVLFLDSDILLPNDALVNLLSKEKDIITAAYLNVLIYQGEQIIAPPIYKIVDDEFLNLLKPEALEKPMLIEIGATALSCCLIKRDVLERLTFRKPERGVSESISFFEDAIQKLGFKAWADTAVKCVRQPYPDGDERNVLFLVD